jgi:alpha-tubulin suppressor-like RCC1 family protein
VVPDIDFLGGHVIQIACGMFHSVCITSHGKIGIWGTANNGRLGLGTPFNNVPKPRNLEDAEKPEVPFELAFDGGSKKDI